MIIRAREYYGRGRTGWVLLAHGTCWHFPGRTGLKDLKAAVQAVEDSKHRAARCLDL